MNDKLKLLVAFPNPNPERDYTITNTVWWKQWNQN